MDSAVPFLTGFILGEVHEAADEMRASFNCVHGWRMLPTVFAQLGWKERHFGVDSVVWAEFEHVVKPRVFGQAFGLIIGVVIRLSTLEYINNDRTARNRVPELWFEDDNLILHAENTVFRVSKGVLAARSSVFRDMLSFPQTVYVSYQSDRAISIQGVSKVSVGILRVGYEQGLNSRQDINQD
ncbi:hypothetical protein B0H14DRAFT_2578181 [Mycena olivaceomarginata]|nr:hypothetical protein B0H14DRAFT_2578181 [Mycena olivaceomarginata]